MYNSNNITYNYSPYKPEYTSTTAYIECDNYITNNSNNI